LKFVLVFIVDAADAAAVVVVVRGGGGGIFKVDGLNKSDDNDVDGFLLVEEEAVAVDEEVMVAEDGTT
jgi:hypothetical protein